MKLQRICTISFACSLEPFQRESTHLGYDLFEIVESVEQQNLDQRWILMSITTHVILSMSNFDFGSCALRGYIWATFPVSTSKWRCGNITQQAFDLNHFPS